MFKISNLTAKVANKVILDDFSMQINDGEIHAIMGKNGIGKSSLCKIILKDKTYTVLNGKIEYNGANLTNLDTNEIAKLGIGLVLQNPLSIEGVSNAEVLRTALREKENKNINIYEFNKTLEGACDELKLDRSFIHRDVNAGASGGERKKVELLHVAILKPSLLILDEIDSGLDVDALKVVTSFINEYHKNTKCSVLIITHHSNILEYIKPNYIHVINDGKIIKTDDASLAKKIEKFGFDKAISMEEK